MWAKINVRMGVVASMTEPLIAWEYSRPKKKNARFRFVPNRAESKKSLKSARSTFLICLYAKGRSRALATAIRRTMREKIGISVNVIFMIGTVAPQMTAAMIR